MADPGRRGWRWTGGRSVLVSVVAVVLVVGCVQTGSFDRSATAPPGAAPIQPWEWWRDLSTIAVVRDGDRSVMRSSFCPSGCEYDRHSADDSRFIRVNEHGEGVIFETAGAGAVTRIWMVMGDGVSEPLDPSIRLRVRIDGRPSPVIDLALPELFSGSADGFPRPLVGDIETSGGGNVSYVPIPFRDGCEVSLVGADDAKLWFQVNARLIGDPAGVRSYPAAQDLAGLERLLDRAGEDPWTGAPGPTVSGTVKLAPGGAEVVAELEGPDVINGIILRVERPHWQRIGLRLTFDDGEPQLIPIFDLFGIAWANQEVARSLLFGADGDDDLYCYFPMPFDRRAVVEIMRRPVEGPPEARVEYAIRRVGRAPPADAGRFRVQVRDSSRTEPGAEYELLDVEGRGSLVGLFARFGFGPRDRWGFLEGDEKIWVDHESEPSWHGTGIEDLFGGGFYFRDPAGRPAPFRRALHGAPVVDFVGRASPVGYRLLLGDAVVFTVGVRATIEHLPVDGERIPIRSTAFYYLR